MNTQIATFPSRSLYNSSLISHPSVASRTLLNLPSVINGPDNVDEEEKMEHLEPPVVFLDTSGCEFFERTDDEENGKASGEGSKSNENEAEVVRSYVEKLVSSASFQRKEPPYRDGLVPPDTSGLIHL